MIGWVGCIERLALMVKKWDVGYGRRHNDTRGWDGDMYTSCL